MKLVYIAGPISRDETGQMIDDKTLEGKAALKRNIRRACEAFDALAATRIFSPVNPMLSCYSGGDEPSVGGTKGISHQQWLEMDKAIVARVDAVLRLPGQSDGADQEVAHANKLGIPVFHNLAALIEHFLPPETGTERRRNVLADVAKCVCRDRQNTYGDAEDNFADIAAITNVCLKRKLKEPLDALDVATFSAAIKMGRIGNNPSHRDSWVDLAGYAVCGSGILDAGINS